MPTEDPSRACNCEGLKAKILILRPLAAGELPGRSPYRPLAWRALVRDGRAVALDRSPATTPLSMYVPECPERAEPLRSAQGGNKTDAPHLADDGRRLAAGITSPTSCDLVESPGPGPDIGCAPPRLA